MKPSNASDQDLSRTLFRDLGAFFRRVAPSRALLALNALLILISSLLEAVSMGMMVPLIDLFVRGGDLSYVTGFGKLGPFDLSDRLPAMRLRYVFFGLLSVIMLATTLRHWLIYLSESCISRVARSAEHRLRTQLFDRYLDFGKRFVDRSRIGDLVDLNIYQTVEASRIFLRLHNGLMASLMIVVYLAMMFAISYKLALSSLLLLPPIALLIRAVSGRLASASVHKARIDQRMSSFVMDALSNIGLVQASCAEARESRDFRGLSEQSSRNLHGIYRKMIFASHAQEIIMTLGIAALLSLCVLFFFGERTIAPASFMVFFLLLRRLSSSTSQLGSFITEVSRYMGPIQMVLAMMDDADKPRPRTGRRPYGGLRSDVRMEDVHFGYGDTDILKGLNVTFKKGEVTAVVGPTGAGKSTIVQLLLGLQECRRGKVLVDGVDLAEYDIASFRSRIGYVDQNTSIFNTTLKDNLTYACAQERTRQELDRVTEQAQIRSWVASLPEGYDTLVGDRGVRLSGGERQRVAIARALLKDPEIFIFDEATSSLDIQTEVSIQKAIESAVRGRTTVVIAHRVATIRSADRIVFLEKGVVVEQGSFEELIRLGGRFYHYWQLYAGD